MVTASTFVHGKNITNANMENLWSQLLVFVDILGMIVGGKVILSMRPVKMGQ